MSVHRTCCCGEAPCCFVGTDPLAFPSCVERAFDLGLRFRLDVTHRETGFAHDDSPDSDGTLDITFSGSIQFEVFETPGSPSGECELRVISNNVGGSGTYPIRANGVSPFVQIAYSQTATFSNWWAWQPAGIFPYGSKVSLNGLGSQLFDLNRYVGVRHSLFGGCPGSDSPNCQWNNGFSGWQWYLETVDASGDDYHDATRIVLDQMACSGSYLASAASVVEVVWDYARTPTTLVASAELTLLDSDVGSLYPFWCKHETSLTFVKQTDCSSGGGASMLAGAMPAGLAWRPHRPLSWPSPAAYRALRWGGPIDPGIVARAPHARRRGVLAD